MVILYDEYWLENMCIILMPVYTELGNLIQHDPQQYQNSSSNSLTYGLEITKASHFRTGKLAVSGIHITA